MEENCSLNFNDATFETIGIKPIIDVERWSANYIPSADKVRRMIERFLFDFTDRYPGPGPISYIGPLNEALEHSLFDSVTPCPLVLYIHHDRSIAVNIFCHYVLSSPKITDYLAEQFLVWTWDRTRDANYSILLSMLFKYTTEEVATTVASFSIDAYPLLVCLSIHQDQIDVVSVIQSTMSTNEVLSDLLESRKKFDRRAELPHSKYSRTNLLSNENLSISPSVLQPVTERSPTIERITRDFKKSSMPIVRVDQVENVTWLTQYLEQKRILDAQLGHDQSEQFLFHGCPRSAAERIVQHGFDHKLIGMHGASYGYGFYFSSNHLVSDCYTISDQLNDNERVMLVCRVLIGRTCLGNSSMRTCPTEYDSTTNGSNIYVVYSNRQILPVYVITYKPKFNTYQDQPVTYRNSTHSSGYCTLL